MRRLSTLLIGVLLLGTACAHPAPQTAAAGWADWEQFAESFITEEGRVVDWTTNGRTVSEGQAYGMFFALVANDRQQFDRLLAWTEQALARGDLTRHLPAWLWGPDEEGIARVLDENPATDADLWMAHSLLEAARLWGVPAYEDKGRALLTQIKERSIHLSEDDVPFLLPAPQGFVDGERVRLNPSYLVPVQLQYLEGRDPSGPWGALREQLPGYLATLSSLGRIPDWSLHDGDEHRLDQSEHQGRGSYDAIRVYLWAGFRSGDSRTERELLRVLAGYADLVEAAGRVPEHWYARSNWIEGQGPVGFDAALLPFWAALGREDLRLQSQKRIAAERTDGLYGQPARYYDQVLVLFGKGYDEAWFRFDNRGRLVPRWTR